MSKEPIIDRIERWYDTAKFYGIKLERILIHPDDVAAAPKTYKGLPVVPLTGARS